MDEMRLIDGARLERGIKMMNFYSEKDKQFIIELVRSYPTIEAELVRNGRWIEGTSQGSYSIYCPYCGARMDGDDDAAY